MISRLIDAFYWMGRYMERAENTARIVNVNYHASMYLEEEGAEYDSDRDDGPFSLTPWSPTDPDSMVEWLILDEDNPSSVPACLSRGHLNAQTVRNKIDKETWECVNRAYIEYGSPDVSIRNTQRLNEYCTELLRILHEFTGTLQSNMFRAEGWFYLRLGRFLERADNCLRQLQVFLEKSDPGTTRMETQTRNQLFLESVGATMLLQDRDREMLEDPEAVTSFLLGSTTCPRSFRYSLTTMEELLSGIRARFNAGRNMSFDAFNRLKTITGTEEKELVERGNFAGWLKLLARTSDEFLNQFKQNTLSKGSPAGEGTDQFEQSQ